MRRAFFPLILAALLLVILPLNAAAAPQGIAATGQSAQGTGIYVVRQGDTLFRIASRHCMTTNELMSLNAGVISNPNQIWPGMQLRVVNRCGGGNPGGGGNWGVCDRGPTQHAQGVVTGNRYLVARGDTSFSIANRFGISVTTLCQANGINPWNIWAGQTLVIPGLTGTCGGGCQPGGWNCQPPVQPCWNCPPPAQPCWNCPPPALPTPTPTPAPNPCWNCPPNNCVNCQPNPCRNCPPVNCKPGWNCPVLTPGPWPTVVPVTPVPPTAAPTAQAPFLVVERPVSGELLPRTFTVSGRGGGLFEDNVVVVAQTATGQELARQSTRLQGSAFSVQLTTPTITANTPGWIIVWSPQSRVDPQFAQVTFSPGG